MIPTIALAVLQALPQLLQTGFAVSALINHTVANPTAEPSPAESFAAQLLGALPNLISAGTDVIALVNAGAASVAKMQAENRGPTDQEKADQATRLAALDAGYDKAAGNP